MANAEQYRIENLTFTYPERDAPALSEINLTVNRGEFLVLCGHSGCGKTTLLRQLKPSAAPHGVRSGEIFFENTQLAELSHRDASARIGFVTQSPDNQVVTDKVWHELAFGLESLGLKQSEIRLRVAEMASFFGIQNWFYKNVGELSGGQKQLLNLASVMCMQPSVLILDEPTSQLDPIAASDFLASIGKINRELGITVIMTEHRLEEIFPMCDRAVVMEGGCIIADGEPREVALQLRERGSGMFLAMPTPMRVWAGVAGGVYDVADVPVTVRDGRNWIDAVTKNGTMWTSSPTVAARPVVGGDVHIAPPYIPAITLDEVWFKYEKDLPDVVRGLSFTANYGEVAAILGGNGTGKTTTLSLISGVNKPYRGKVTVGESWAALPQNPQALFVKKTVREDLREMSRDNELLARTAKLCLLDDLLDSHPYDLSGGEQQRAALAKVLLLQPKILLLDEPTKGLDAEFKLTFAAILRKLTAAGVAVVMVSHDVEFCAEHADRCAMFFDGNIVTEGAPREFFSGNSFYTTSANRMARHVLPEAVTANDVIVALGGVPVGVGVLDDSFQNDDIKYGGGSSGTPTLTPVSKNFPLKRKNATIISALCLLGAIIFAALNFSGLKAFVSGGDLAVNVAANGADAWKYVGIIVALGVCAAGLVLSLTYKRDDAPAQVQMPTEKRKLSKRTLAAAAMILLAIPLTIYIGVFYLGDRKYYFISLLIILETMLPFALVFESRKPQARELVVIATLCAIAVAGRAAFFMLPQFKPVVALVIIAGVAFGGESGFLVGAMTGFVSNMFFGQGPWTPWQMFSFGIIGFLAGVLFRKGILRRSRAALCVFGALATLVIYGGIMDTAQIMMYQSAPTRAMFLAAYLQGIPFNLVHAVATVVFLLVVANPMLEKLDRIKVKYGLVE
ncbi:MAG: ATP-binding cassette domain-containing protein [Oscillospiraceae bacterium]|jgi:energy-coupling factor transport system ATP-binding protein|nr:ATP-binding cassette domain-containing protein [Oscillospiraceae bacterium]